MTTAQNAPVEATSRMKSIMSSTGMPRKNSSSTVTGTRMMGLDASRPKASSTANTSAPTIPTAAAASVASAPSRMSFHTRPSWSASQRVGSRMGAVSLPFAATCGIESR